MRALPDSLSPTLRSNTMNDLVNGIIDAGITCILFSLFLFLLDTL